MKTNERKMHEMRIYEVNACRAKMFDMLEMKNEIISKDFTASSSRDLD